MAKALMAVAIAAGLLAGAGAARAQSAQPNDEALVPRGEYLARAADCMPCHSASKDKPYAGGLALNTPFGAIYSPNITPDPTTGIGKWTYEQFVAAVRDGIRADGAFLYPAMPFDAYTGISDDDMKALWAYIRRLPPVTQEKPENQLGFPFNIRLGLLAWRELFFESARFTPTAGKSDEWNRGAYLVGVLGHCTDCHTPRNIMGATKGKDQFLGAEIDGFWAPAISTANLKANGWTPDTLGQFFKTGSVPGKTSVFGPMAEVIHDSLSFLTDADIKAMTTYLFDAPPPSGKTAPQMVSPLAPEVQARAAKLYVDNCVACHQEKGTGAGSAVPPLAGNPAVVATEPYNVIMAVLEGVPSGGTYGAMPSFAGRLNDQQVADLVNYVRTSWGNTAAPSATSAMVAAWRATANVPNYGTQASVSFTCPKVGGAPGADGPNAKAVAAISGMMQQGSRETRKFIDVYRADDPDASSGTVVDALTAAYCPVVAQSTAPDWQKYGELRRFTLQAAAAIAQRAAATPIPDQSILWAVPAGKTLVGMEPANLAAKLACPADDGKAVPKPLSDAATTLMGTAKPPVAGTAAAGFATTLAGQFPKARPADVANALIATFCRTVAAQANVSVAEQNAQLNGFGQQVIQTLQLQAPVTAAK